MYILLLIQIMEINNDFIINQPIDDTVSCLRWYPESTSTVLASGGWDSKVRIFNISYMPNQNMTQANFNSNLVYTGNFENPILSMSWVPSSTPGLITGDTEGIINLLDLTQPGKATQIGKHDIGAKEVIWVSQINCVVSGGWDGRLCFWDPRTPNQPALFFDLGKKVYSMSHFFPLLVIGMQDRVCTYLNLSEIGQPGFGPKVRFESHLKYQTRAVAVFPEANGYGISSIEGRVAIKYIDRNLFSQGDEVKQMNTKYYIIKFSDDFAFRCHRTGDNNSEVYPVNSLVFNPVHGTFCSGGGDGTWMIWDKESRTRLKQGGFQNKASITALDYCYNGDILAYAGGYDWAKGVSYEGSYPPKIGLHFLPDSDKKKKPKK